MLLNSLQSFDAISKYKFLFSTKCFSKIDSVKNYFSEKIYNIKTDELWRIYKKNIKSMIILAVFCIFNTRFLLIR